MWTVGRCILYTGIRLLLNIHPFISSFFFLSNFLSLKSFVTLFSGTVRPRRLKLGTHMDSRQVYRVYQNQTAAAYSFLYFPFLFLSNFQTWKSFVTLSSRTVRPRSCTFVTHVEMGGCIVYTEIMLLLLFIPLFFIFLSLHFSNIKNFRHTFLWNCEA